MKKKESPKQENKNKEHPYKGVKSLRAGEAERHPPTFEKKKKKNTSRRNVHLHPTADAISPQPTHSPANNMCE